MRMIAALLASTAFVHADFFTWKTFPDVGIDCTGITDSTFALQSAIDALPNYSSLVAPSGCVVGLSSTVSITNRTNIQLLSFQNVRVGGSADLGPSFVWHGTGGMMLDIEGSTEPLIQGFGFNLASGATINTYVNIDGGGTAATIASSFFDSTLQTNPNFKAISIAATSNGNNENTQIINVGIECSPSQAALRGANDGVLVNGSTTLNSATANFSTADVGKRVRVSYATGILDTTIVSYTDPANVVMAAPATTSQTGATIHTGQAYGTGVYNGPSSNAKNQGMYNVQISYCGRGIDIENGSFSVHNLGGGFNDIGVFIQASTETSVIENDQSEGNLQALYSTNPPGTIVYRDSRLSNFKALASGYFYFWGGGRFTFQANTAADVAVPNSVLFGFRDTGPTIFSAGNNFYPLALVQVNYTNFAHITAVADVLNGASNLNIMLGLPISATALSHGQLWTNGGVLSVVP